MMRGRMMRGPRKAAPNGPREFNARFAQGAKLFSVLQMVFSCELFTAIRPGGFRDQFEDPGTVLLLIPGMEFGIIGCLVTDHAEDDL